MRILDVGAGDWRIWRWSLACRRPGRNLPRATGKSSEVERDRSGYSKPGGDLEWPNPPTVTADGGKTQFDLLGCKAHDPESVIEASVSAVDNEMLILPLLNGIRHLDVLKARFGVRAVLGGHCFIFAALDGQGHIRHYCLPGT
jgi:Ketopantoate reductase PanE/ApbA